MNTEAVRRLSKFGTVKTCKVVKDSVVTIVLTKDFSENALKTLDFLNECTQLFPDYGIVETCITEKHLAIVVLTK